MPTTCQAPVRRLAIQHWTELTQIPVLTDLTFQNRSGFPSLQSVFIAGCFLSSSFSSPVPTHDLGLFPDTAPSSHSSHVVKWGWHLSLIEVISSGISWKFCHLLSGSHTERNTTFCKWQLEYYFHILFCSGHGSVSPVCLWGFCYPPPCGQAGFPHSSIVQSLPSQYLYFPSFILSLSTHNSSCQDK